MCVPHRRASDFHRGPPYLHVDRIAVPLARALAVFYDNSEDSSQICPHDLSAFCVELVQSEP